MWHKCIWCKSNHTLFSISAFSAGISMLVLRISQNYSTSLCLRLFSAAKHRIPRCSFGLRRRRRFVSCNQTNTHEQTIYCQGSGCIWVAGVSGWFNGIGFMIKRSCVRPPLVPLSHNDSGQVIHMQIFIASEELAHCALVMGVGVPCYGTLEIVGLLLLLSVVSSNLTKSK